MNKIELTLKLELLNKNNLVALTEMTIELWPECNFNAEKEQWEKLIDDNNHFVELVKINEHYIGFIHFSLRHEYVEGADFETVAYLEAIYTKPDYRNLGIANKLLISAEKWARSKGLKQIASDVEMTNSIGQIFHHHSGFTEVNRIVCFIKNL